MKFACRDIRYITDRLTRHEKAFLKSFLSGVYAGVILKVQLQLQSCFFGVTYLHNNVRSGVVGWWGGWAVGVVGWGGLHLRTHLMLPCLKSTCSCAFTSCCATSNAFALHSRLMLPYLKFTCIPRLLAATWLEVHFNSHLQI